jgi:hypothetical protein
MSHRSEPEALASLIATVAAVLPITPERAAANAQLLDEEVAAFEATHVADTTDLRSQTPASQHRGEVA